MRTALIAAVALAAASVASLYAIAHETRTLEGRVAERERAVAAERDALAILRAERAFLLRPERLQPFARRLGLRPAEAAQFVLPNAATQTGEADSMRFANGAAHGDAGR